MRHRSASSPDISLSEVCNFHCPSDARAQIRRVLFGNFSDYPPPASIRDAVKLRPEHEVLSGGNISGEDEPGRRRDDINILGKLPTFRNALNLHVTHAEIA
jgi:hypothetical protein